MTMPFMPSSQTSRGTYLTPPFSACSRLSFVLPFTPFVRRITHVTPRCVLMAWPRSFSGFLFGASSGGIRTWPGTC